MIRVMTAALAGVIATATIAGTLGTAEAGGRWQGGYAYGGKPWRAPAGPPPGPRYHGNGGGNWGAAVVGGAILGLALGAVIANDPPPPPRYAYAPPPPPAYAYAYGEPVYAQRSVPSLNQAHVDWCAATYPDYQPATDTFLASNGVYYRCVGPY